ncbi:hypothetical protein, partial [uncultured Alistipes sp.]|uniref:hypothetical protein n=1 Tax=uncultured Alistipes sp. TaxID=538949 RepID=UPI002596B43B
VLNGHIILTDTSITTILAPEMTYTPDFRPASFVHRKTRGGRVVPTYVPFAPREGCAEIAA